MRRPRTAAVLLTAVAASGGAAGSASAACAPFSGPFDAYRLSSVVLTAVAEPGPTAPGTSALASPATFRVLRYDRGAGPAVVRVTTGTLVTPGVVGVLSEGIRPTAGERWRINGTVAADGTIATSICSASVLLDAQPAPVPLAKVGDATVRLRAVSLTGEPARGRGVRLRASSARRLRVGGGRALGLVRSGDVIATGTRRGGAWRVPAAVLAGDRIVVDTGDAFYGATVR